MADTCQSSVLFGQQASARYKSTALLCNGLREGADIGWQMLLLVDLGAVPAIHRARESLFWAPLGHIGPRGGLNLSSPSTVLKVNHLFIRYLCF